MRERRETFDMSDEDKEVRREANVGEGASDQEDVFMTLKEGRETYENFREEREAKEASDKEAAKEALDRALEISEGEGDTEKGSDSEEGAEDQKSTGDKKKNSEVLGKVLKFGKDKGKKGIVYAKKGGIWAGKGTAFGFLAMLGKAPELAKKAVRRIYYESDNLLFKANKYLSKFIPFWKGPRKPEELMDKPELDKEKEKSNPDKKKKAA